ncbi:hypothetical protein HPP92_023947 [Vanilla planifolia]|uniref:Protein EARLY FLOWERING 4 domain-containing protein n=1 Tax=Vanilla planifolia TaxID=51239 RepID=A0A835UAW0_VANPL|nr:hypothetical protein HPP92_023947 [Vanilla planifolia]
MDQVLTTTTNPMAKRIDHTPPSNEPIKGLSWVEEKERTKKEQRRMEEDPSSGLRYYTVLETKVLQSFQASFVQVQNILNQNSLLIKEINQNHESMIPCNLGRNPGLIRELNDNMRRVVELYRGFSNSFLDAASDGDSAGIWRSDGKFGSKRNWSG